MALLQTLQVFGQPSGNFQEKFTYSQKPTSEASPLYGGVLKWGVAYAPTLINPILTQNSVSAPLLELVFDSLIRLDSNGEVLPGLAKSWVFSSDGLVIDFYLQQGVRFHDGVELTADDVKFTYEQIMDPSNQSPWRSSCELFDHWEVIDRYTVRLYLRKPVDSIFQKVNREIAPKHLLEKEKLRTSKFNYAPIGSGPFRFYGWDRNTNEIKLKANRDYFEGRPYLDEIVVKTFSSNEQLWSALLREEVDLVEFISEENYEILKKDPTFKTYAIPWSMHLAMVYNLSDPVLTDRDIRIALAHAVNVKDILKNISEVSGSVSLGPVIPTSEMFNPLVKPIEFSPQKAVELFRKHGWVLDAQSGIFKRNGQKLEIRLLVDQRNKIFLKLVKIVRQQLAEVGVKLTAVLYQDEKDLLDGKFDYAKPQAWVRFMSGADNNGYEIARDWYSPSSDLMKSWQYSNPEVNELFIQARSSRDPNRRKIYYQQIHEHIYGDQPALFFYHPVIFYAVNSRLKNTDQYFGNSTSTYSMKEWYVSRNDNERR